MGPNMLVAIMCACVGIIVFVREIGEFSRLGAHKTLLILAGVVGLMLATFPSYA